MRTLLHAAHVVWAVLVVVVPIKAEGHNPTTPLAAALDAEGYVEVPITRGEVSSWWVVKASIDGKPVRLMIDTGSGSDVLDKSAAERLKYPLLKTDMVAATASDPRVEVYREVVPRLELGPFRSTAVALQIMPLSRSLPDRERDRGGFPDGILGAPTLHHYSAVLDYGAERMYLLDPAKRGRGLIGKWVAVKSEHSGYTLPATFHLGNAISFDGETLRYTAAAGTKPLDYSPLFDFTTEPNRMTWVRPEGTCCRVSFALRDGRLLVAAPLFGGDDPTSPWPRRLDAPKAGGYGLITYEKLPKAAPGPKKP
jgi:hypothetical protein